MRRQPYVPNIINENYVLVSVWNDFQKSFFWV
jgi:hypothetical protein